MTAIDLERREVQFAEMAPLSYDYLVLGLGAVVNFFGTEGAAEHAFPMYTLADALRLREHVLQRWEAADRDPSLVDDGALNIVVVGGGPTGVESAGALGELYRSIFSKDYRQLPQEEARIVLVEASLDLFGMFKQEIRDYTKKALEKRGVEVRLGELVASVSPTRVTLKSGEVLEAHTLVWGAGLQACPITTSLGLDLQKGNRIEVAPDLSVPGHDEVFAVGDIAWITDAKTDAVLPQLGSVALQSGEHAGENIARRLAAQGDRALRIPRQGHDGHDRPRSRRPADGERPDDEGPHRVPRVGRRPPRAAVDGRRPGQDRPRLDVGGLQPRAPRPHQREHGDRPMTTALPREGSNR